MRSRNTVWEGTCSGWAGGARASYPRDGRPAVWPTFRRVRFSPFLSSLRARGRKRGSSSRRIAPATALRAYLPKSFAFRGSCPRQRQLTAAPQHRQNRLYHHYHYRRRIIRSFNANTDATDYRGVIGPRITIISFLVKTYSQTGSRSCPILNRNWNSRHFTYVWCTFVKRWTYGWYLIV